MNSRKELPAISLIIFKEHPVVNYLLETPNLFDITSRETSFTPDFNINRKFLFIAYCTQLIHKLISLQQDEIPLFLKYQAGKVKNPIVWLKQLEVLIHLNTTFFISMDLSDLISSILYQIDDVIILHKQFKNHDSLGDSFRPFHSHSFNEIKEELATINPFEDKLAFLINRKTEYLQNEPIYINRNEKPLSFLIDLEMEKIQQLKVLEESKQVISQNKESKFQAPINKIRFNDQLNVLVDLFYQLKTTQSTSGKNYLEASIQDLTNLIVNNFLDKDGNEISPATVRTILSPNRHDKRPKKDKSFKIK